MTAKNGWLANATKLMAEREEQEQRAEAERREREAEREAERKISAMGNAILFFSQKLDLEFTELDVVGWAGNAPIFRVAELSAPNTESTTTIRRDGNGATLFVEREGAKSDLYIGLNHEAVDANIASLMAGYVRISGWLSESLEAKRQEEIRKAEEERSRQSRVAAKRQSDAETAQAMAVKTPAITISSLYQMLWHVTRIRNVLICADKLTSPFQERLQLEALEMLRQLVDSANQVAAKLSAEKEESDDIPF